MLTLLEIVVVTLLFFLLLVLIKVFRQTPKSNDDFLLF